MWFFPRALAFVIALLTQGNVGLAQTNLPTVAKQQYDSCLAKARSAGLRPEHIYIAWAGGLASTCLQSNYPPDHARRSALEMCEKSMQFIRSRHPFSVPCKLVRDRGKIIDKAYGNSLRSEKPVPVDIQIFDGATGQLQKSRGLIAANATKFNGPNPVEHRFEIKAKGITLCLGRIFSRPFSTSLRYEATCFNQTFTGTSSGDKVIKHGDIYALVPNEVRISRDRSWMSIRF